MREDELGFLESGSFEVPIGFVEALAETRAGRFVRARLRGDFIAPAAAVHALETSLAGSPLDFTEIGLRVDAAFGAPFAFTLGVTTLQVFARAILSAGNAAAR